MKTNVSRILVAVFTFVISTTGFSAYALSNGSHDKLDQNVSMLGRGHINTLAWQPNGRNLLVGSNNGTWLYSDSLADIGQLDNMPISYTSWSPDGNRVAIIGSDGITVINPTAKHKDFQLKSTDFYYLARWSPDGKWLAATDGRIIHLWDSQSWQEKLAINTAKDREMFTWSPDSNQIAAISLNGLLQIWRIADQQVLWSLNIPVKVEHYFQFCPEVEWAPTGKYLVVLDCNQAQIIDTASHQIGQVLGDTTTGDILSVAWSLTTDQLAIGGANSAIEIWGIDNAQQVARILLNPVKRITTLAWDSQNQLTGSDSDNAIHIWANNGYELRTIAQYNEQIQAMAWSPNDHFLAGVEYNDPDNYESNLRVWDITTGKLVATAEKPTGGLYAIYNDAIDWRPDGKAIVSTTGDRIVIWETDHFKITQTLVPPDSTGISVMKWSPNGNWLAVATDTTIYIWDAHTYALSKTFPNLLTGTSHNPSITGLSWTQSAQRLAFSASDRTIGVIDIPTASVIWAKNVPRNDVEGGHYNIAWSDHNSIISNEFKLNAQTGEIIAHWITNDPTLYAPRQNHGDETIITNQAIYFWDTESSRLSAQWYIFDSSISTSSRNPLSGVWNHTETRLAVAMDTGSIIVIGKNDE